jgi:hypothetical protein
VAGAPLPPRVGQPARRARRGRGRRAG